MQYIKPENLIHHNDKLLTLEVLREHTLASNGDDVIRQRIIHKIDAQVAELKASVFEKEEPDGSIRIRHPAIGVMHINHELLDEPTQLFASHIKSLVAYTITISRADAVVCKNQLIRYEPYEVITKFRMSQADFSGLTASPGRDHFPATFEVAKHYRIDSYLPDAMANKKVLLSQSLVNCLDGTEEWLQVLMGHIGDATCRASKPTKQQVADIDKYVSMLQGSVVGNPSYSLENLAEFAEEVKAHGQQEVEALMTFQQMNEGAR